MPLLLHNFNPVMAISWFNDSVDWLGVWFCLLGALFFFFILFVLFGEGYVFAFMWCRVGM